LSRTDAHRPLWVRLARGDLAAEAEHASDHAVCDLPDHPPVKWEGWLPTTRCNWTLHYTGTNICSCSMCHAGPQHRQESRNHRHRDRIALQAALGRWTGGDEAAFDELAPPSRVYYW
jgi:hypothetical protein